MLIQLLRPLLLTLACVANLAIADSAQYFHFSNDVTDSSISIKAVIDEGYYLNKNNLRFSSATSDVTLSTPEFQSTSDDKNNIRNTAHVVVPYSGTNKPFKLLLDYVGCSDEGFCFPPAQVAFAIEPPTPVSTTAVNTLKELFGGFQSQTDELLEPDKAFSFRADISHSNTVQLSWQVADGYYLYQDKIGVSLNQPNSVQLVNIDFPKGKAKHDETFGDTIVYYHELNLEQRLIHQLNPGETVTLTVTFQGCADIGVCYPPMSKTVQLIIPAATQSTNLSSSSKPPLVSETDQIAQSLFDLSFLKVCILLFGAGLALSFTPCVFPMIPILSGIIIGQGENLTRRRAFLLSLSYVVAAAAMYAVFGILAGLFGSNLQATFQNPWILSSFSLLFVLLALSMFGLFELQLPSFIQSKLASISQHQKHNSLVGSFIMGGLSALIVGPCVAAPLAGVLIYIGQTGDAVLGGFALFSLGLGMGVPLIIIGMSAGELLPKAGKWMEPIKYFFGVMLIAVAIWLMERILPGNISLALWAALLIVCAIYLKALDALPKEASGWQKLFKGLGVISLIYGIILIIGAATGGSNPFNPLSNFNASNQQSAQSSGLQFQRVKNAEEFKDILETAAQNKQTVMLDFYADWCVSCKEMEHFTFTDPQVKQALSNTLLIQADVTANNTDDRTLLNQFKLIGPPAILFFNPAEQPQATGRVIGYLNANDFLTQINNAI